MHSSPLIIGRVVDYMIIVYIGLCERHCRFYYFYETARLACQTLFLSKFISLPLFHAILRRFKRVAGRMTSQKCRFHYLLPPYFIFIYTLKNCTLLGR